MAHVAIIGAGITGLVAAHTLRKAGVDVTLYEGGARAGGVIRSRRDGPWLAEGGPNTILDTSPRIRELVEELGLGARRCDSNPEASARYVVRGGRPVLLPGSGPAFFTSKLFSTRAKFRLLREPFIPRGKGEESVADFVRRRLGQEFLDYAIDPLVTGIYAGDPAALSIEHAFAKIHALEAKYGSLIRGQILGARERRRRGEVSKANARKFSFDEGLQTLPDTLAARLGDALRLQCLAEEIERLPDGAWRVSGRRADEPFTSKHAAVLFCGTAHSLARLRILAPDVPSLAPLADVYYPPVTSVVLGFRREDVDHPCMGFGMLIPGCEGFRILGAIFSSALFPRRAPENHVTLTIYVGGARQPAVAELPDDELIGTVLRDLRQLLGVRGRPVFQTITRWPRAIPQYQVGYGRFKDLMAAAENRAPGLFIAGHYRDGVALSDSILTGTRSAERICACLSERSAPGPTATAAANQP